MALPDHKITISPANNNDIPKQAGDVAGKGANGSWVSLAVNEIIDAVIERVKALLGTANFADVPPTTLQDAYNHANAVSNPHGVTPGQVGNTTAQWNADKIQGSTVDVVAPTNQQVLTWSSSSSKVVWAAPPGLGGGEANTATNTGVGGVGVFKEKNGINLEFRNISSGSNKITVTNDSTNNKIDIDVNENNLVITKLQGRSLVDTAPLNNQAIVWDNANTTWKPGTVSGGGSGLSAWQVKSANYTATDGDRLQFNTVSSPLAVTLPFSPVQGSAIELLNLSNNSLTINLNGSKYQNLAEGDVVAGYVLLGLKLASYCSSQLIYGNALSGWIPSAQETIQKVYDTAVTLTYSSDGDNNDLFSFIGTNYNTGSWINPHSTGAVTVFASSTGQGTVALICDRASPGDFYTNNVAGSYIAVDIGAGRLLTPNKYSLQHYSSASDLLRNWSLRGSNNVTSNTAAGVDSATWTTLDTQTNNTTLSNAYGWVSPIVAGATVGYRWFQVLLTGVNGQNRYYFTCNEWKLYGSLVL